MNCTKQELKERENEIISLKETLVVQRKGLGQLTEEIDTNKRKIQQLDAESKDPKGIEGITEAKSAVTGWGAEVIRLEDGEKERKRTTGETITRLGQEVDSNKATLTELRKRIDAIGTKIAENNHLIAETTTKDKEEQKTAKDEIEKAKESKQGWENSLKDRKREVNEKISKNKEQITALTRDITEKQTDVEKLTSGVAKASHAIPQKELELTELIKICRKAEEERLENERIEAAKIEAARIKAAEKEKERERERERIKAEEERQREEAARIEAARIEAAKKKVANNAEQERRRIEAAKKKVANNAEQERRRIEAENAERERERERIRVKAVANAKAANNAAKAAENAINACVPKVKGWKSRLTSKGKILYYNNDTKETSWKCPTPPPTKSPSPTTPPPAKSPSPTTPPPPEPTTPALPARRNNSLKPTPGPAPQPNPLGFTDITFSKTEVSQGTNIEELNKTLPALQTYVASLRGQYYGASGGRGLNAAEMKTKFPEGWESFPVDKIREGVIEIPKVKINGKLYTVKGQHATLYVFNNDIKTITDGINQKGKDILGEQRGGRRKQTRRAKRRERTRKTRSRN